MLKVPAIYIYIYNEGKKSERICLSKLRMLFCDSPFLLLVFASTRFVLRSDEFRTTFCIDIRLNVRHWPRFTFKKFISSVSVIDTEASGIRPLLQVYTRVISMPTGFFRSHAIRPRALNTCINHFLCAWLCPRGADEQLISLVSEREILLER